MRNGWANEQLLAALSQAMNARQAVPSWFVGSGKNAYAWHNIGAELGGVHGRIGLHHPAWAAAWPQRTWAVEGAGGTGHLLDWQLVSAGERVLDVQPKLGAGPAAGRRGHEQERPPRCPLGGQCRAALARYPGGQAR